MSPAISGEILAGQFVNLGAKVILSARNVPELERVKNELAGKFTYIDTFVFHLKRTKVYFHYMNLDSKLCKFFLTHMFTLFLVCM